MWLRSSVAMAMAQAFTCSSDSTPSQGTSTGYRSSHKKAKKKKKRQITGVLRCSLEERRVQPATPVSLGEAEVSC